MKSTCDVQFDILPICTSTLENLHNARVDPAVEVVGCPRPVEADVHTRPGDT